MRCPSDVVVSTFLLIVMMAMKTPDNQRKLELVDARSWDPRKQADAGQRINKSIIR